MQKRSESEHADIDIGNQVADINLEMLPYTVPIEIHSSVNNIE